MKKRVGVLSALVVVLIGLAWFLSWVQRVDEASRIPRPAPKIVHTPPVPGPVLPSFPEKPEEGDPVNRALLAEAAAGALGVEALNEVCSLCETRIVEGVCESCPKRKGPYALVRFDKVDADGSPLPRPDRIWVRSTCGGSSSKWIVAPAGSCSFTMNSHDRGRPVYSEPVQVELVAGTEYDVVLQAGSVQTGTLGLQLGIRNSAEGRSLMISYSDQYDFLSRVVLLEVNGEEVGARDLSRVQDEMVGSPGTVVSIRYRDRTTGETVDVDLEMYETDL